MVTAPAHRCKGLFERGTCQDSIGEKAPFSAGFMQGGDGLIRDKSLFERCLGWVSGASRFRIFGLGDGAYSPIL
jgi:hypothetical protein